MTESDRTPAPPRALTRPLARSLRVEPLTQEPTSEQVTRMRDEVRRTRVDPTTANGLAGATPARIARAFALGGLVVAALALYFAAPGEDVYPPIGVSLLTVVLATAIPGALAHLLSARAEKQRWRARLSADAFAAANGLERLPRPSAADLPAAVVDDRYRTLELTHPDVVAGEVQGRRLLVGGRTSRPVSGEADPRHLRWLAIAADPERTLTPAGWTTFQGDGARLLGRGEPLLARDAGWIVVGVMDDRDPVELVLALVAALDRYLELEDAEAVA